VRFKLLLQRLALAVTVLIGATAGLSAQTAAPPAVEVGHAWSRATPGTGAGVVYLSVINHGQNDDILTHVATPAAKTADIHISVEQNGVMTMRPVSSVTVKAGQTVEFKPEGLHIMLMGLAHPLAAGDSFPVTLTFEKAGTVQTPVTVEKAGEMMDHHSDMPGMPKH
jgi:copper(I)-binding protein